MSTTDDMLERILTDGGFIHHGKHAPGLIDPKRTQSDSYEHFRYGDLFASSNRAFGPLADLVYEVPSELPDVPGTTSIYFKALVDPSHQEISELRKNVWNTGRTPTLWVITHDALLIYDGFARPQLHDDHKSHLLHELRSINSQLLRMHDLDRNAFDSGEFWQSDAGLAIDPLERVDKALLADLKATERLLIQKDLPASVGHALMGRCIFTKYLEDRSILKPEDFSAYGTANLVDTLSNKDQTYKFFTWLRETLNGDLFPLTSDEVRYVGDVHLQILEQFFSGSDMKTYPTFQTRLWPYRFDVIPIELISSVYELFAHSSDPLQAEANSVHYTRLDLAELVLGMAMRDCDDASVVLDPACGSGVFLVSAFRRLVWLCQKRLGRSLQRSELHQLLRRQIFGIDIDRDAILVTAFSLYLALVELDPDPDPRPLAVLRLPRLSTEEMSAAHPPNLYVQDFFNTDHNFNFAEPFVSRSFDVIVGNPPWTALEPSTAPRDPDNTEDGVQWGLRFCKANGIPDRRPDQGFMIRARDFASPKTRVSFIVGSRIYHQTTKTSSLWYQRFLEENTLVSVINLSDYVGDDLLFGKASSTNLPASVFTFLPQPPIEGSMVTYVTPRWSPVDSKRDSLVITSGDIQFLSQALLKRNPSLWKSALYGTARDLHLLQRLEQLPTLASILTELGLNKLSRGITFGLSDQKDVTFLRGKPYLQAPIGGRYGIDVESLPSFERITAKRPLPPWKLPALIAYRSLRDQHAAAALAMPTESHDEIVVDQGQSAVSLRGAPRGFANRLNAVLNSDVTFYFAFMRSPAIGSDRRLIEHSDWVATPLPRSIVDGSGVWQEIEELELWLRTRALESTSDTFDKYTLFEHERMLNQAIYQAYQCTNEEVALIEDAIEFTILPLFERNRRGSGQNIRAATPSPDALRAYVEFILDQLNGLLGYVGVKLNAEIFAPSELPLIACRFSSASESIAGEAPDTAFEIVSSEILGILEQISISLRSQIVDQLFVRKNLRVYDESTFWIMKPSNAHLWTRSAALEDVDAVIREHMEVSTFEHVG